MKPSHKTLTMITVSFTLFMDVLDSNIINTAIPAMSRSLNVSPVDLKIALISYFLSLAVFIPVSGWTADKYGTKHVFIAALGIFTFSSFWCGYAASLTQLVIARCFQGIGGAFMLSLGRLIIVRTFKRHELMEAMNTIIILVALAVMLGPFVGGFITDHFSWPWIFWVNIPPGILAILIGSYAIKDTTPKTSHPFDYIGFVLFGGSLALFCFALSELSETNAKSYLTLLMIAVAVSMFIAYIFHAKHKRHPVIRIDLMRIRTFRISVSGNLFSRLGFNGMPFLLPLMQQIALGFSAQFSGLLLVPMAFGIIFSKLTSTRILRRVGYKNFLVSNTIIVALVVWTFQIIDSTTPPPMIAMMTFILGTFVSAQFTAMNSIAFADIPDDILSAATSITSTVQIFASSLGVAISAILLRYFASGTTNPILTISVFHHTFFALGALTMLSAMIFMRLRKDDGKQMLSPRASEPEMH